MLAGVYAPQGITTFARSSCHDIVIAFTREGGDPLCAQGFRRFSLITW